jgi:hypothetical protein
VVLVDELGPRIDQINMIRSQGWNASCLISFAWRSPVFSKCLESIVVVDETRRMDGVYQYFERPVREIMDLIVRSCGPTVSRLKSL